MARVLFQIEHSEAIEYWKIALYQLSPFASLHVYSFVSCYSFTSLVYVLKFTSLRAQILRIDKRYSIGALDIHSSWARP